MLSLSHPKTKLAHKKITPEVCLASHKNITVLQMFHSDGWGVGAAYYRISQAVTINVGSSSNCCVLECQSVFL